MHKTHVYVNSKKEGPVIRRALEDDATRAFVLVMGYLLALDTDRARARVLQYVADKLDEEKTLESAKSVDAEIAENARKTG